jgi:hypothetical protein
MTLRGQRPKFHYYGELVKTVVRYLSVVQAIVHIIHRVYGEEILVQRDKLGPVYFTIVNRHERRCRMSMY